MHAFGRVRKERNDEVPIHILRHKRHIGRDDFRERGQHGVKRRVSRFFTRRHLAAPETVARAADVPVGKHVNKRAYGTRSFGNLIFVQPFVHGFDKRVQTAQYPSVHNGEFLVFQPVLRGVEFVYLGIQHEERISVPQRAHKLALRLAHVLRRKTGRQPRCGRSVEIPSRRVRALLVEHRERVDDVALVLAHLYAVLVVDVTEHYAVAERRLPEQGRGNGKQRIEPSSRLVHRFGNEVRGESFLENILVFERIMPLRERHRAAVVPAVQHFGGAHHFAAAFALQFHLVDVGTVQLDVVVQPAQPAQLFA